MNFGGNLTGVPGFVALGEPIPYLSQHGLGHGGFLTGMGLIGESAEAAVKKRFDPEAHRLLVRMEVNRDFRNAPALIAQMDHFKSFTSARHHRFLMGSQKQIVLLGFGQMDKIHYGRPSNHDYEVTTQDRLEGHLFRRIRFIFSLRKRPLSEQKR